MRLHGERMIEVPRGVFATIVFGFLFTGLVVGLLIGTGLPR